MQIIVFCNLHINKAVLQRLGNSICGKKHYLADILSSTVNIVELTVKDNCINDQTRPTLFNGLYNNRTMKIFIMVANKLIDQDIEYIERVIQNNSALKEILLNECEINDNGTARLIEILPESSLDALYLSNNSLDDRGCAKLLSSISVTVLTESSLQTIINLLTANQTLKILVIRTK